MGNSENDEMPLASWYWQLEYKCFTHIPAGKGLLPWSGNAINCPTVSQWRAVIEQLYFWIALDLPPWVMHFDAHLKKLPNETRWLLYSAQLFC